MRGIGAQTLYFPTWVTFEYYIPNKGQWGHLWKTRNSLTYPNNRHWVTSWPHCLQSEEVIVFVRSGSGAAVWGGTVPLQQHALQHHPQHQRVELRGRALHRQRHALRRPPRLPGRPRRARMQVRGLWHSQTLLVSSRNMFRLVKWLHYKNASTSFDT